MANIRFSEAAKSNIDIIVPTIAAGAAFYYLKEKQKMQMEKLLIYTALAFGIMYLLTSKITGSIRNQVKAPDDIVRTNPNESSSVVYFNASSYSDRIYKDIDGINFSHMWGGGRDQALYKEMEVMSNDQLIQVANQFKNDYYSKLGESLVQALEGETYDNLFTGTQDRVNNIITRLKALGV